MTENPKKETRDSTNYRLVSDDESKADIALSDQTGSSSVSTTIEREAKPANANLRGGQALSGWRAILFGLVLIFFDVLLEFQMLGVIANLSQMDQLCAKLAALIPALFGMLFLVSGAKNLAMRQRLKRLKPGKETWEAEFGGRARNLSSDSGRVARRYVTNFLIGQVVFLPAIYLGWTRGLSSPGSSNPNFGAAFVLGILSLWYLAATVLTFKKVKAVFNSNRLEVKLDSFPLFLGQQSRITLSNADKTSPIRLEEVTLRCLQERVITHSSARSSSPESKTVSREAVQLYAETRRYKFGATGSKSIPLTFAIPDAADLSTSLLIDDPLYWCLDVKGSSEDCSIESSFLLPVYKRE